MVLQVNVKSNIDDTTKLQNLINTTGNIPVEFIFSDFDIEINLPVKVYNNTKFTGNSVTFTLMDNAPVNPFDVHVPMFGSKYVTGITGLEFSGFTFKGNYSNQKYSTAAAGSDHGKGYHDCFFFGNFQNRTAQNITNCSFHDMTLGYNQGDELRIEGGSNINAWNIKSEKGGHDVIFYECVNDSEIYNCDIKLRSNSGIRVRACNNIKIHDNKTDGSTNEAWSPGIQVDGDNVGHPTTSISIYNNKILNTYAPGIWILGDDSTNKDISIYNNLFLKCGRMPANNKISGVGGIVADGFENIRILGNTFDQCYGFAIGFANYQGQSASKGMKATVQNNIITNTQKSFYPSTRSGTAISNELGHYTITSNGNCLYKNISNYYNIPTNSDIYVNPCYVGNGDYHLQSKGGHYSSNGLVYDSVSSPCIYENYELGCYSKTNESSVYFPPPTHITPNDIIGNSSAVIILCNTLENAETLTAKIKGSTILNNEKIVYYSP